MVVLSASAFAAYHSTQTRTRKTGGGGGGGGGGGRIAASDMLILHLGEHAFDKAAPPAPPTPPPLQEQQQPTGPQKLEHEGAQSTILRLASHALPPTFN